MVLYTLFYILICFLLYWGVVLCLSEIMKASSEVCEFEEESEEVQEHIIVVKATLVRSLTV
tara:strand:+ start:313 stop:495 length:183 start_codon:yes stop_codon:yes gene_type:complete